MDTESEEARACAEAGHTHQVAEQVSDLILHSLAFSKQFFPRLLDCIYGPFLHDIQTRLTGSPSPCLRHKAAVALQA